MPRRATPRGDQETRARVLTAATRLFAERGFAKVTVRDICRKARANVAAVNYHFGGKEGLYRAVMQTAIETMQDTTEAARAAGRDGSPEERLRAYVSVFLRRIVGRGSGTWIHQVMMREISDPTPSLELVIEQVMKPRMAYLCEAIAELIGCAPDDIRVSRCALSLQSQFQSLMWNEVLGRFTPRLQMTPDTLDEVAEHITHFSLGGVLSFRESG
jgi:TetR/AcrR family transcriptional regulator, regulator of cefoperazone and chloramphenicol sensitivity